MCDDDDDFKTKPSKSKLSMSKPMSKPGEECLLVESKWKGSEFVHQIKEQVQWFLVY
jgi:hypothetical protein